MQRWNIEYNIDVHSKRINIITIVEKITTGKKNINKIVKYLKRFVEKTNILSHILIYILY